MDYQEAWTLQGSSLSNCTLRNEMYKLTLNIRITVLAEPTDILGNPRITSALITISLSEPNSTATSKSNSASSSCVKEDLDQKGGKSSNETPRLILVKPGTDTKVLNPFTHQRDRYNPQEAKLFSAECSKTGATAKQFFASDNLHKSKGTLLPRRGLSTLSSSVKIDSPQNTSVRTKGCTDSHRIPLKCSATNWKPTTPSTNEVQLSSFSATTRIFAPQGQSDANLQERNGNRASETVISPYHASTSESPRKVRKWKRNSEGNQKISTVGLEGNSRPTCGLKRNQEPLVFDVMDEDGTFLSSGSSTKSITTRNGGHSPQVVIKRQNGFPAVKGDASENSGEKLKYSKSQLEVALNNLRKDTARQEKEKVVHWKLQAAVRLLKTETEHKLTLIAKAAFEDTYTRRFKEDIKRNSWLSKDVSPLKRTVSSKLQRNLTPTTPNLSSLQNKRPWTYPFRRVSSAKEEVSLAVSHKRGNIYSQLQMLLKLWIFLPVPLLSLAYVTFIYGRKKKSDA